MMIFNLDFLFKNSVHAAFLQYACSMYRVLDNFNTFHWVFEIEKCIIDIHIDILKTHILRVYNTFRGHIQSIETIEN